MSKDYFHYYLLLRQVKILYVRNLMLSTSEETLYQIFSDAGGDVNCVQHVKKIKDYAFIHFYHRYHASVALKKTNCE